MSILKKIVRGLSTYGFRVALFGVAFSVAFVLVFGTPEPTKTAVEASGLYDIPLTEIIDADERLGIQQEADEPELSINDPIVQEAVVAAFPPDKKQQIVETVLDGTYVWLNDEAQYPDFTIDISGEKTMIIKAIADSTFKEVSSLEPCTFEQLQRLSGAAFDPLNAPCKPPIDLSAEKQKFIAQYSNSDEFLSDTTVSGEELFKEAERHDLINGINNIPTLFGVLTPLPFILGVMALLAGLGVVVLSNTRHKGVRALGSLFIQTAILLAITGVALYLLAGGVTSGLSDQGATRVQAGLHSVVNSLRWDIALPIIIITVLYLLAGIGLLLLTRKKASD